MGVVCVCMCAWGLWVCSKVRVSRGVNWCGYLVRSDGVRVGHGDGVRVGHDPHWHAHWNESLLLTALPVWIYTILL